MVWGCRKKDMRKNHAIGGLLLALLLGLLPVTSWAQFASGGSGQYRGEIFWFDWGAAPNTIPQAGTTQTNQVTEGGRTVAVTCSLSGISGGAAPSLQIYRPGGWWQDGLDELYNIGGTGTSNTMDIGLRNRVNGQLVSFNFACSATVNGVARPLDGLVFADAETLSASEYIEADMPAGSVFRVIERFRAPASCTSGYQIAQTGVTYRFTSPNGPCTGTGASGPMAIGFIDSVAISSATVSATVRIKGDGITAVALGLIIAGYDFVDAPASYGSAAHQTQGSWVGGSVTGTQNIYAAGFTPATRNDSYVLGTLKDTETAEQASVDASGDDTNGIDDENAVNIAGLPRLTVESTGSYVVPVVCQGTGFMRGWIDFNLNGVFDSNEASGQTTCAGGSATLTFTLPAGITPGRSFLRIRYAADATQIASPVGIADSGEVEDHAIPIYLPLQLQKSWQQAKVNDALTVAASGASGGVALSSVANTPTEMDVQPLANRYWVLPSGSVTLSEAFITGTASDYGKALACTGNTGTGAALTYTADATSGTLVVGAASTSVVCTFTNTSRVAALAIDKTNNVAQLTSGTSTTYTITVSNGGPANVVGALVRDVATGSGCGTASASGLCNCTVATQCSVTSGTATCPTSINLTWANLTGSGVQIPLMNANSSIQFQVSCQVF